MSRTIDAFRALAGDAVIAVGELVRGGFENVEQWPAQEPELAGGAMECDGPQLSWPAAEVVALDNSIPRDDVRSALDDLPDSQLLRIAATVLAGWKPILLKTTGDMTDIDLLVSALRDRAHQFHAVELDADRPFLKLPDLRQHLT